MAVALVLAACGGAGAPGVSGTRDVSFTDHGSTAQSRRGDATPHVVVGASASARAELEQLLGQVAVPDERVPIGVFQGQQRTGGYAIRVTRVVRADTTLEVHAAFTSPPPDAIVTMVLTSPAHLVSVARGDAEGLQRVVLLDQSGSQRVTVTGR